ncbi:hypothetical protein CRE_00359 [Caenorhabditis remanei]|uniref:Uncharacterized protein n=1 Tax=Caenorhabditis remanei TaxID=31234 RepID=E3LEQ6_CAERE|nr:hypothetical protein CRE_00359 [Caenorhabditis remanei]
MILIIFVFFLIPNLVYKVECQNETNFLNDYGHYADSRMRAIGEYFSDLMGCGAEGWCAFRCCPTERQHMSRTNQAPRRVYPNPVFGNARNQQRTGSSRGGVNLNRYPYVNRNPAVRTTTAASLLKQCANACMPQCTPRCLQRYNQIVASFMNSLTAIDVMGQPVNEEPRKNIRFSPKKSIECRDECMPYCTPQCLDAYSTAELNLKPKVCKAVCMPDCTEECVTAPPLMVPCIFDNVCHCPAGYVRCSEMTCCMKYKTMAVRYRNRMTSMSFSDDDENEPKSTGNETSVYLSELRNMGGGAPAAIKSTTISMRTLPNNSSIVYYPEQGKAEILKNDGSVVVEVMESAQATELDDK